MSTLDLLKMQLEAIRDQGKIFCPHCRAEYYYQDDPERFVTYYGYSDHGREVEATCQNEGCEKDFKVKEYVTRTFETRALA